MADRRVSLTTGAILLTAEQIAEHGRACREHVANADAAIARARAILDGVVVSDAEAAEAADSLVGPVLSGHVQRAFSKPSGERGPSEHSSATPTGCASGPGKPDKGEIAGRGDVVSGVGVESVLCHPAAAGEETPPSPWYCACGCGRRRDPVAVVVERASYGVSLRAAIEDISAEYGLTDAEAEWVETQAGDELEDLARCGRTVHL